MPPMFDLETAAPEGDSDGELFDAYSRTVSDIAATVGRATLGIRIAKGRHGGAGSGFLFASDGYALTNSHVVHGASRIEALLPDGEAVPARLVGEDPDNDLAVLRLAGNGLKAATLGR